MAKTAIVFASRHHGNTRKMVEKIAEKLDVKLINALQEKNVDLSAYDFIGFASGIDFGTFYDCIYQWMKQNLPEKKRVFFLYTCARLSSRITQTMRTEASKKGTLILGEYGCKGFNTYGPWKLIGGMNKNHPTEKECDEAVRFVKMICENESVTLYQNS